MAEAPPLSIAFIERSPDNAARVLEGLEPASAAAVIGMLPSRIAGLAIARMTPLSAARCLAALDPDQASGVLRAVPFQDAAGALRVLEADARESLLEALPQRLARDFERSLRYPRDSVGAWMDQQESAMPQSRTVQEALQLLRQPRQRPSEALFVIDEGNRYVGILRLADILRLDGRSPLGDVIDRRPVALSGRATLSSVAGHADWDALTSLAVVGRKGNFLGTLSRRQLRAGISALSRRPARLDPDSILTHMLTGCFVSFAGLLSLMMQAANPHHPGTRSGDDDDD